MSRASLKKMSKLKDRIFIVMWCREGLEAIVDITDKQSEMLDCDQKKMWDILGDLEPQKSQSFEGWLNHTIQFMTLRARFNTQRSYEIYSIKTVRSITEEDLAQMFENNPQSAADLIRERGTQIYSDRNNERDVVIR